MTSIIVHRLVMSFVTILYILWLNVQLSGVGFYVKHKHFSVTSSGSSESGNLAATQAQ